jgi:FMN phosphatase YigB (HAD superfamily)
MSRVLHLRAVLLDAGGTLIREREPRRALYAAAAAEEGRPLEPGAMGILMERAHGALPRVVDGHFRYSQGWFGRFIERIFGGDLGLDRAAVARVRSRLLERFADPAGFVALPGSRELLAAQRRRGRAICVVSNWSEALPGIVSGLGLEVDHVVVSAIERCEKPEPEIFRRALARAGAAPHQALHAGNDGARDVNGAHAAGILGVLVGAPEDGMESVEDLRGLARWIEERAP